MSVATCSRKRGFALKPPPPLREGQEEALLAGESADHDVGLALERQDVGVVRRPAIPARSAIFSLNTCLPLTHRSGNGQ